MAQQSIITQVSRDNDSYQPAPAPDRGQFKCVAFLRIALVIVK